MRDCRRASDVRRCWTWGDACVVAAFLLVTGTIAVSATAQLKVESKEDEVVGFAGQAANHELTIRNVGTGGFSGVLRQRLWQRSSSTMQPIGEAASIWSGELEQDQEKTMQISTEIPATRTAARYSVRILDPANLELATVQLVGVPEGWLAKEVATIRDGLTIWDPANRLCPSLKEISATHVRIEELSQVSAGTWGILVLVATEAHREEATTLARRMGADRRAVLLFDPRADTEGRERAFCVASPGEVSDLATNPKSQLRFLSLLRAALQAKKPDESVSP